MNSCHNCHSGRIVISWSCPAVALDAKGWLRRDILQEASGFLRDRLDQAKNTVQVCQANVRHYVLSKHIQDCQFVNEHNGDAGLACITFDVIRCECLRPHINAQRNRSPVRLQGCRLYCFVSSDTYRRRVDATSLRQKHLAILSDPITGRQYFDPTIV